MAKRFINRKLSTLLLIFSLGILWVTYAQATETSGYYGVSWQASFPELEKTFPGLIFESENSFHLTTFSLQTTDEGVVDLQFKLFQNRLVAVVQKYSGPLTAFMNEKYIKLYLSGLGKRQKIEYRKIPTAQGMTDTILWDYGDVLVFFQTYPAIAPNGVAPPLNIIKFVHKETFMKMKAFIKDNPDGDFDSLDDDFDAVSF